MNIVTPLILFPVALCVPLLLPADGRADEAASTPNVLFLCVNDMRDRAPSAPTRSEFQFDDRAITWTNNKSDKVTRGKG
jgi:hypothetical protein